MAFHESTHRQTTPSRDAVACDRIDGVLRTGRLKPARRAHEGRNDGSISVEQAETPPMHISPTALARGDIEAETLPTSVSILHRAEPARPALGRPV